MDKIANFFKYMSEKGVKMPLIFDPEVKRPSATLLFAYSAHIVALGGIVALLQTNLTTGVLASTSYGVVMVSLFIFKRLTRVKIDVKAGQFEIESAEQTPKKEDA